jgi:predicted phage tail protein
MSTVTPRKRRTRIGTVIWGAALLTVGVLVLLGELAAVSVDPVVVALGLLVGVGLSLIIGGVLSLRNRPPAKDPDTAATPPY